MPPLNDPIFWDDMPQLKCLNFSISHIILISLIICFFKQSVDTQPQRTPLKPNSQQGSSFSLQLFQGTLDEALSSFQKSIHEDVRNLHIEVLRQFHLHEVFFLAYLGICYNLQCC